MTLPRLYAIVDTTVAARQGWQPSALARAYLAGGARLLQVRGDEVSSAGLLDLCDVVVQDGHASGAAIIVNDRADIALLSGADGVHVGQDDLPIRAARRLLGRGALVGISTHTPEQIEAALLEPISYIAVGPIFTTRTKATGETEVGLELVRRAAKRAGGRPVVAIGGITLARAAAVIEAGASTVAVIADLLAGGPPDARVRAYVAALGG